MDFDTDGEHLQLFVNPDDMVMPAPSPDHENAIKTPSLAYIDPSWENSLAIASSNLVTMEPLTPLTPSQGSAGSPLPSSSSPDNTQHPHSQATVPDQLNEMPATNMNMSSEEEVHYATVLAASLLAEVSPLENHDVNHQELTARPVVDEKPLLTPPHDEHSRMSDEWSVILEHAQQPDLHIMSQLTKPSPATTMANLTPAEPESYEISSNLDTHNQDHAERKSFCPDIRRNKSKRGSLTRPRKMSKREAAKAATAAALAEELRLAHLAKTKQITDDELLRLKPKKKRRAAKFDRPVPSRFCHVCSRTPKSVRLAVCSKIKYGTCRKVICEKCFQLYGYGDFDAAKKTNETDWLCPHCKGKCPPRAQCRTYQRINDRLRISRLKQERPRGRSSKSSRHSHVQKDSFDGSDEEEVDAQTSENGSNPGAETEVQDDEMILEDSYMNDTVQGTCNEMVTVPIPEQLQEHLREDAMQLAAQFENVEHEQSLHDMPPLGEFIPNLTVENGASDVDACQENTAPLHGTGYSAHVVQEMRRSEDDGIVESTDVPFGPKATFEVEPEVMHAMVPHEGQLWSGLNLDVVNNVHEEQNGSTHGEHEREHEDPHVSEEYQSGDDGAILNSLFTIDNVENVRDVDNIYQAIDEVGANDGLGGENGDVYLSTPYVNADDCMGNDPIAENGVIGNSETEYVLEADCLDAVENL